MVDLIKFSLIGVVAVFLMTCGAERVWYQQDTSNLIVRSDLAACRSTEDERKDMDQCMQAKGYVLIPRSEAELLMVRTLQREGLDSNEIGERLGMSDRQVRGYMDEDYDLPQTASLGIQPVEILTSVGKPAVQPLIGALEDDDPLVRRQAAEALGEIGDPRALEPLIGALNDADPLIRRHSVQALGKIGDPRAVDSLIAVLEDKDEEPHVRMTAAEALGRLGGTNVVEPLSSALNDEHWGVRSRAARALGQIKDPRGVGPLIARLNDEDATVRGYAAEALGDIGDPRAVEPLVAVLDDDNGNVREKAKQSLDKIAGSDFGEQ